MSIKKLAAAGAYDYLTRQVAAQDASVPAGGLTSYYTERGDEVHPEPWRVPYAASRLRAVVS